MLSWSSNQTGDEVDLTTVAAGAAGVGLAHGDALLRFATACAEDDAGELSAARDALIDATDVELMVDAAAVAANFEMMTRLADATGATLPSDTLERRAAAIGAMGAAEFVSRR